VNQEPGNRVSSTNAKLVWLVAASFLVFAFCVFISVGVQNTPYDTVDTQGRKMGFNDVFSLEHYAIIFSNFKIGTLFDITYAYEWPLFLMHLIAIAHFFSSAVARNSRVNSIFSCSDSFVSFVCAFFLSCTSACHSTSDSLNGPGIIH
jgi:hypothetical protein